ncbi:MAG: carboxypeptidase-like regulatory domain-containing protein [Urechidicola sp.]|nr:carboxypeptidase-like regulatory domain-containing protein [Urechidicola sp.]
MKNQINLEINTPCSENFNQFTPTLDGGFCGTCQKEVIDFSKKSPEEIMNYFKNYSNQDTCGKFNSSQLKTYSEKSSQRKKLRFLSGIGLAFLSLFTFNTMQAQTETVKPAPSKTITTQQEATIIVKGTVSDDTTVLPGVSVLLEGTTIGTETDFDGNFEFPKPLKNGDVLVFSFIGLKSQKVVITDDNSASDVALKVDMQLSEIVILGKVAVKKVYSSKR